MLKFFMVGFINKTHKKIPFFSFFSQAFRLPVSSFQTHSYSLHALFHITHRSDGSEFFSPLRYSFMFHIEDEFSPVQQFPLRAPGAFQSPYEFLSYGTGSWLKQSHLQAHINEEMLTGLHWGVSQATVESSSFLSDHNGGAAKYQHPNAAV